MKRIKHRMIRVTAILSSLALVASVTSVASTANAANQPKRGGILQVATDADPGTLDPNLATAFASWYVTENIYGGLLQRSLTGKIVPDVAISYSHPNSTEYKFKLRAGIRFSNGVKVTSADVKYSFERIINPKTASAWSSIFDVISSIATPNASTVIFHLKSPFSPFLSYVSFEGYAPIISQAEVKKYGSLKDHALGTGPFVLESYTPNVSVVLKRNPYYYEKGRPYLNGINFQIIPNDSTRLAAVKSGEVKLAWFSDPRTPALVGNDPSVKVLVPSLATNEEGLTFNQKTAPFNNTNVRRAVSEGIDRNAIIKLVLNGHGQVGSKIPPGETPYGYNGPASGLPYSTYKPTAAKDLLKKAGYPHGFTTTLNISANYAEDVQAAQLIKSQLAKIGITVNISEKDWTTVLTNYVDTTYSGMSMIPLVWQPDPDADAYDIWYSKSSINLGKFNSPIVDSLLTAGRTEQSVAARTKTYLKLENYVAKMAYMVFPYDKDAYDQVVSSNVHGFVVTNSGLHEESLVQTWLSN
jgi:peptide/nickel transport system substrate-binding protein